MEASETNALGPRAACVLAGMATGGVLAFDLSYPLGIAGGVPYAVVALIGLLAGSKLIIAVFAVSGTALTILGFFLSASGADLGHVLVNRALAIVVIWSVAILAIRYLVTTQRLMAALNRLAITDPLTGLYTRRHVFEVITHALDRFKRYGDVFAVILIDADRFKQVNDRFGHGTGDLALRVIARACSKSVRESDIVGRFGGEEFIVVLPSTNAQEARVVAERIRETINARDLQTATGLVPLSVSAGVAQAEPGLPELNALLQKADTALYAAKNSGRNIVVVAAPETSTLTDNPDTGSSEPTFSLTA